MLDKIDHHFSQVKNQPFLSLLYRTILSVGYHGLFRIGELTVSPHVIKFKDVFMANNKPKALLALRTSKTHWLDDPPQTVKISALEEQFSKYCPHSLLVQYRAARGHPPAGINEPLYLFLEMALQLKLSK